MQSDEYTGFLNSVIQRVSGTSAPDVAAIYHHIRQIPYGGAGQRDPQKVYEFNAGTCSGKHILLRDLLRSTDREAEVVTVFTHFNKGIPAHSSMPEELKRIITEEEVPDYHHFVRLNGADGQPCDLDATWCDDLAAYGFPTNYNWRGPRSTQLAGAILEEFPVCEDIISQKIELLAGLNKKETEIRTRFLAMLTDWISA